MFLNYLKIAFRNIYKHPRHSLFNILGLSIGMAAAIIILSFILHEMSYDDFHQKKNRIYRLIADADISEGKSLTAPVAYGMAKEWAENEFPSVESVIRIDIDEPVFTYNQRQYRGNKGYYTDSSFLQAFSFEGKYGNTSTALAAPDHIVLVEDMSERLFGDSNPVGKVIKMKDKEFQVAGVLREIPPNSHLDFDFLVPIQAKGNLEREFAQRGISTPSYILFKHPVDEKTQNKVASFVQEKTNEIFSKLGIEVDHHLQPLEEIHLNSSHFQLSLSTPGNKNNIYTLSALALLIILIAVINYVNMETARSENRAREIGMRKVSGAGRRALIGQFLGESLLLSFIALLVAFLLVEAFLPDVERLLQREFHQFVFQPVKVVFYVLITIVIGLLAGFYPALYLSEFNPVRILRGNNPSGNQKNGLRKLLVVVQFAIATFLIISLLFINRQIHYLKNKDLGFAEEQVMVMRGLTDEIQDSYMSIRQELADLPGVQQVSAAQYYPGDIGSRQQLRMDSKSDGGVLIMHNRVDPSYRKALDFRIKKGRYFREDRATDSNKYVVNQKTVDYMGLQDPIGKQVVLNQEKGRIIGIMDDYHTEGLQREIMPMIHTLDDSYVRSFLLRVNTDHVSSILDRAVQLLGTYDPDYQLDYTFLDDYFAQKYKQEERIHQLSMAGSLLAIFIAILGLYALSSFIVIKRTKEIGVRKAMGATGNKVALLINTSINKWVLLANILAWPLAYYFIRRWLQNFAYHIDLQIQPFVLGTIIALLIAVITVSYHTLLAARTNPAETLREE